MTDRIRDQRGSAGRRTSPRRWRASAAARASRRRGAPLQGAVRATAHPHMCRPRGREFHQRRCHSRGLLRRDELVERDGIYHRADADEHSDYRRRWEDEAAEDHVRSAIATGQTESARLRDAHRQDRARLAAVPAGTPLRDRARDRRRLRRIPLYLARERDVTWSTYCAVDISADDARALRRVPRPLRARAGEPALPDLRLGRRAPARGRQRRPRDHERRLPAHGQELRPARRRRDRAHAEAGRPLRLRRLLPERAQPDEPAAAAEAGAIPAAALHEVLDAR